MDLENQRRVKELAEKYGAENCLVLLGASEAESAALAAETVTTGDPTFAGPLAGVALNLAVYHILEPEVKEQVDYKCVNEECSAIKMQLDCDAIIEAVSEIRNSL